jgi:hypothetical protein
LVVEELAIEKASLKVVRLQVLAVMLVRFIGTKNFPYKPRFSRTRCAAEDTKLKKEKLHTCMT